MLNCRVPSKPKSASLRARSQNAVSEEARPGRPNAEQNADFEGKKTEVGGALDQWMYAQCY